jgi:flagellar M-ring protein FliF
VAFIEGILPQSLWDRIGPVLSGYNRTVLIAGGAVVAAVIGLAVLWSWGSSYSVLYAGLSGEEGGHAIAELQKLNIPYRITDGGRVIQVPAPEVGRARLQLAARGVAKRDSDEWAVLDNESLGVSPFVEQVHYVRGIESALSRTVREVDGVVSAKVTLALPKQTDFLGDSAKPSGSVLLRLRPDTQLTPAQVDGLVGLIASSVPGLARENVTIVDQTGKVLNPGAKDGLGQVPQQLDVAREVTHRYEGLITDLLAPVLGRGNFRVSADADIDFSQTKESLVKYGSSHVLSQDETIHVHAPDNAAVGGIPGALSNQPPETPVTNPQQNRQAPAPPAPAAPARSAAQAQNQPAPAKTETPPAPPPPPADTHKTTNYDIDRTVQVLEHPSWSLRGINIAVLVNNPTGSPISAERLQSVRTLVASAVGAGQNAHVTVVDLPFEVATTSTGDIAPPWWKDPWLAAVEQDLLLALAGLLAMFGGVFPLLRRVTGSAAALASAGPASAPVTRTEDFARAVAGASTPAAIRSLIESQDVFSVEAETVQTLVAHDPARTAQVIRGWIAGDRHQLKQAS